MLTTISCTQLHSTPSAEMRRYPGADVAVWRTTTQPGSAGPVHEIDREQIVVVVEGTLSVTIDGTTVVAEPGDAVLLPAGAVRQLRNDGNDHVVTLTCAVPGGRARVGAAEPVSVPWSA